MLTFVLRRLGQLLVVVLLASIVLFAALQVVPGDPARRILGTHAPQEQVDAKRAELGLDRPLVEQYLDFAGGVPAGDLGTSLGAGQSVADLVSAGLPITLQLVFLALAIALAAAIPIAVVSAAKPGGWVDNALTAVTIVSTSVPTFVWGLSMVLLFSVTFKLLPSSGYVPFGEDPVGWLKSMIMPAVALALPSIGTLGRVGRAALLESMREPFMHFARSKGIGRWRLYLVHALKHAAVPIVAVAGAEFAYILGDAVVVEWIFALPGTGKLMVDAFAQRDYPIIQGVALVYTVLVVLGGLLADVLQAKLDPRMRLGVRTA